MPDGQQDESEEEVYGVVKTGEIFPLLCLYIFQSEILGGFFLIALTKEIVPFQIIVFMMYIGGLGYW
jgi:hypothetical protein